MCFFPLHLRCTGANMEGLLLWDFGERGMEVNISKGLIITIDHNIYMWRRGMGNDIK